MAASQSSEWGYNISTHTMYIGMAASSRHLEHMWQDDNAEKLEDSCYPITGIA